MKLFLAPNDSPIRWSYAFVPGLVILLWLFWPEFAHAGSPFETGASALVSDALAIFTPLAVLTVMALGVAAWFDRLSWSWAIGIAIGMVCVFGATQLVSWVRDMFAV